MRYQDRGRYYSYCLIFLPKITICGASSNEKIGIVACKAVPVLNFRVQRYYIFFIFVHKTLTIFAFVTFFYFSTLLFPLYPFYLYKLPNQRKTSPRRTRNRSKNFDFRFFSWNIIAPKRKLTITLALRTILTMEIIAPSMLSA